MWEAFGCCPEELLESSGSNVGASDRRVDPMDQGGEDKVSEEEEHSQSLHILVKDSDRVALQIQPDWALEGSSIKAAAAAATSTDAMENLDRISSDCMNSTSVPEIKDLGSTCSSSGLLEDLAGVIVVPSIPPPPSSPLLPPPATPPPCDDPDQVVLPSFHESDHTSFAADHSLDLEDPVPGFFAPVVDHNPLPPPLQHQFSPGFHHPHLQSPFFHCHDQHAASPFHQLHRSLSAGNLSISPHFRLGFLSSPLPRVTSCSSTATAATSAAATPSAAAAASPDDPAKAGRYSPEERKVRIDRYRQKRSERNYIKKIKYACRKTLADSRPRIRGRFAKNQDTGTQMKRALDEDDDDEVESFVCLSS